MEDDYTTKSHYPTYTFIFRKVGRMYVLNLGVEGLIVLPAVPVTIKGKKQQNRNGIEY